MEVKEIGRNELCHCGSGIKYKKCCLEKDALLKLNKSRKLFTEALLEENDGGFGLVAFHDFFPELAEKENRVFWTQDRPSQSREPYQIIEYYCADPKCDCNRVILGVADRERMENGTFLSVGFAFDRKDPDAGPYIDPLNNVTDEGVSIYPVIKSMLESDFEYIIRLKRHYEMIKRRVKAI